MIATHDAPRGIGTILVTGASGQVGYELVRSLAPLGNVVAPSSREMDLADAESIRGAVRALEPAIIVNAAAYTAVDRAEAERDLCFAINAHAPWILATEAHRLGAPLVHYSTDYVFDGTKRTPYVEDDTPCPVNVYGASKLAGEQAISSIGGAYLILRTSWVYGARGNNFLRTILRLARERKELKVVSDQVGAPTWSRAIAEITAIVLGKILRTDWRAPCDVAQMSGVYHLSAGGSTSWYDLARAILEDARKQGGVTCETLVPVTALEYGSAATRPMFSVLDNAKLQSRFGCALPDWSTLLDLVLQDLAATT